MRKLLISMALVMTLLSMFAGCGAKHPSALVGRWEVAKINTQFIGWNMVG